MKYTQEFLQMQKLAGIITEGEYKRRLNENQSPEIEAFLKSKGYKIEKVDGSAEANEREGEFATKREEDPNIVKQKNSKAFITSDDLIHDGVKSFMVFIPSLSPESKDNESLKNEIIKKFGAVDPQTGTFFTSLKIPVEKKEIEEAAAENSELDEGLFGLTSDVSVGGKVEFTGYYKGYSDGDNNKIILKKIAKKGVYVIYKVVSVHYKKNVPEMGTEFKFRKKEKVSVGDTPFGNYFSSFGQIKSINILDKDGRKYKDDVKSILM